MLHPSEMLLPVCRTAHRYILAKCFCLLNCSVTSCLNVATCLLNHTALQPNELLAPFEFHEIQLSESHALLKFVGRFQPIL